METMDTEVIIKTRVLYGSGEARILTATLAAVGL